MANLSTNMSTSLPWGKYKYLNTQVADFNIWSACCRWAGCEGENTSDLLPHCILEQKLNYIYCFLYYCASEHGIICFMYVEEWQERDGLKQPFLSVLPLWRLFFLRCMSVNKCSACAHQQEQSTRPRFSGSDKHTDASLHLVVSRPHTVLRLRHALENWYAEP